MKGEIIPYMCKDQSSSPKPLSIIQNWLLTILNEATYCTLGVFNMALTASLEQELDLSKATIQSVQMQRCDLVISLSVLFSSAHAWG